MKHLIFLLSFLFIYSCAEKVEQTNMKISIGAVTGSANFEGGLFILGENKSTNQYFSQQVPPGDLLEIELPNGNWNFLAMGWHGAGQNLEGTVYCDTKQNIALDGGEVPLNFTATSSKCSQNIFGPDSANNFLPLEFKSCLDIKGYIQEGYVNSPSLVCGNGSPQILDGGAQSVRVTVMNLRIGDNVLSATPALSSQCYNLSSSSVLSAVKLPVGTTDIPMPFLVEAYGDTNCGTTNGVYQYKMINAFAAPSPDFRAVGVSDTTSKISVYLHGDACTAAQEASSFFGNFTSAPGGSDIGVPRLVCNETQWNYIATDASTYGEQTYILGKDIDFGGSNTEIATTFNGSLKGNFHTLKNGNSPLFSTISPKASGRAEIRNLNIDNFNISESSSSSSTNVGVLARLFTATSGDEIEIGEIHITNSSININDTTWTGNAGGLFGEALFTSYTNYASVRENSVFVDITTNSGSTSRVGGLIGEARGTSGSGSLYFEINSIGVNFPEVGEPDLNADSVTLISGDGTFTGGMFGFARDLEIREGNIASSNITGRTKIGGLVGEAHTSLDIEHSVGVLKFTATGSSPGYIGGLVGSNGTAGDILDIKSSATNLVILPTAIQMSRVGGMIGDINVTSASQVNIKDSRSAITSTADGTYFGGMIGRFSAGSNSFAGDTVIERSSSLAKIYEYTAGAATNSYRGGTVGEATYFNAKMIISQSEVEGFAYIGGSIGSINDSQIDESYFEFTIEATKTGSAVYAGGLAGKITGTSTTSQDIYLGGNIRMQDNNNCTTLSCGKVTGDLGTSNTVSNIIHYIGMVYDYGGTDTLDSTNVLGSGTLSLNYSLNDSTTCSSLSGRPFVFDSDISECTLIFEKSWRKYGYGYNADSGLNYYKSGSLIEPFEINNADDWNNIGTDIFLVQKAFVLTSDIDFAGGFNPIGTNDNTNIDQVFNGIIIPDGHKIFNITYTTPSGGSETSGGLFPVTGPDARIGLFYDPLRVENVNLTADANKSGIIGESQGGEVAIHAKYISIDGSATNSVGGLVGYVSGSDLRLENSFFHGEIDINTAIGLGGLVGEVQNATGEVSIKESFADVSFLRGADSVGGIIGLTNAPGKIQLENVYSWIDKDGVHAGDDIVAVGGSNFSAGIFGNATSCGSNVSLKNIYTHIDTATLGAGFNRLVNGGTVCSIPTSGFIGAVDSSATADGSFVTPTAYNTTALLYSGESVDSEDKWVLFNGELVLDWQVNGLED